MKLLLAVLLFSAACAGVGWAVVSFTPVLNAGSSESTGVFWATGFTAPVLGLLVVWIVFRMRGHLGGGPGGKNVGGTLGGFKVGALLLALPVFYVVYTAAQRRIEGEQSEVLRKTGLEMEVNRYGSLPRTRVPLVGGDGEDGVIRGKLFVFDQDRRETSLIHFRLPARLQPANPAEVGTVANVSWGDDYSGRGQRWVRLIDPKSGEVVHQRWFPKDDADAQVFKWLESLPQKDLEQ
jgi:hypothetical protein